MRRSGVVRTILIGVAILFFGVASFTTPLDLTDAPWASVLLCVAGVLVIASALLGRGKRPRSGAPGEQGEGF